MNPFVIQTHHLTRYFGRKCAVDQLTLNVPRGSVFALMGRNGSGKSTAIRMMMGLTEPTRGSATILGADSQHLTPAIRERIGFVAEGHPLIDWMSVQDLQSFQRRFYTQWNEHSFKNVVDHFDLDLHAKAANLSRGQRAGVSLALALAPEPELLVMDDPALGLDPVARRTLLEAMILLTRDAGRTILFSSHILNDVERVADHLAIMDQSVLRVNCSVETFRSSVKKLALVFAGNPPSLSLVPGLLHAARESGSLTLLIANYGERTEAALRSLGALTINEMPFTLEDAVIGYLGHRGERATLLQAAPETELAR